MFGEENTEGTGVDLLLWVRGEGDECRCCFEEKLRCPPPQKQYRHNVVIAHFPSKQRPIMPPREIQIDHDFKDLFPSIVLQMYIVKTITGAIPSAYSEHCTRRHLLWRWGNSGS